MTWSQHNIKDYFKSSPAVMFGAAASSDESAAAEAAPDPHAAVAECLLDVLTRHVLPALSLSGSNNALTFEVCTSTAATATGIAACAP